MSEDMVNSPAHYSSSSGIECISFTQYMSFNLGNAFKYVWRYGSKAGHSKSEDLAKAIFYMERECMVSANKRLPFLRFKSTKNKLVYKSLHKLNAITQDDWRNLTLRLLVICDVEVNKSSRLSTLIQFITEKSK